MAGFFKIKLIFSVTGDTQVLPTEPNKKILNRSQFHGISFTSGTNPLGSCNSYCLLVSSLALCVCLD